MTVYRVEWVIDIEADSPREAAEVALATQRNPESIATQFIVRHRPSRTRDVIDFWDESQSTDSEQVQRGQTMNDTITADLGAMFQHIEPWDCSNSVAHLGPNAGPLTWAAAREIAQNHKQWLQSDLRDACKGMQAWGYETGAWTVEEIRAWSIEDCLALFVQNVASELREHLSSDDVELEKSVEIYATTEWSEKNDSPIGYYYEKDGLFFVDYYTGV